MDDDEPDPSHLERILTFVAGIVEGRDPDLGGHHERLGQDTLLFARHIGCSSKETEMLFAGSLIHDIGKLSISEHILNKPARITVAEFALVEQHAEIGAQLLAPLGLDSRIGDIVYYHRENYDGSGYPRGLAEDAIPLLARMVRICDSFDALATDRPYHQGIFAAAALRTLQRESNFYDPDLLNSFCKIMSNEQVSAHNLPKKQTENVLADLHLQYNDVGSCFPSKPPCDGSIPAPLASIPHLADTLLNMRYLSTHAGYTIVIYRQLPRSKNPATPSPTSPARNRSKHPTSPGLFSIEGWIGQCDRRSEPATMLSPHPLRSIQPGYANPKVDQSNAVRDMIEVKNLNRCT